MIELTRLNGEVFYLNPELIETIEGEKNAIVTLTTKKKLVVKETPKEIKSLFLMYKRAILMRKNQGLFKGG